MAATVPKPRTSGIVRPQPLKWHQHLAAAVIVAAIRGVSWTLRTRHEDRARLLESPDAPPIIFAVWHNRLALAMPVFEWFVRRRTPDRGLAAIVSASKDGGLVARVLEYFGVQAVRGSSSRRGAQALLELTTWAEKGHHLAITPDGPRGPCYRVQDGVLALAQVTGFPIVPVGTYLNWKIRVRSWDRFQIPLPFARWEVTFGAPIRVPRELSEEEREKLRGQLEAAMRELSPD